MKFVNYLKKMKLGELLARLDFESVDEFFDKYKEKLDNKKSTPRKK